MDKTFLDYTGLTKYTTKLEKFITDKISGLVPNTRKVNNKALSTDVTLSASDVGAVPTSRTVNGKALTTDITLSASDVGARASTWSPDLSGYVPTSRTVNSKPLTSNITLSASDVSARPSTWTPTASDVGAVPTSRTVNGKALTTDITLSASDVGARASTWSPDLSGYVPTSRTVNSKALTSNITLSASDVSAVPTTRTINGKALSTDITLSASDISGIPDTSLFAPKANPVFSGGVTIGERDSSGTYGLQSVVIGLTSEASYDALAQGDQCKATGDYSYAGGFKVTASGEYSHAEGYETIASGEKSHAEGGSSVASGTSSHAEGQSKATESFAHSEGNSVVKATYSHGEGMNTSTTGHYSHVEGLVCTVTANAAHAEGSHTTASGEYSHAEGGNTTASNYGSHASGKYNKAMTDGGTSTNTTGDVFVVGNGSNGSLSNALRLAYEGTLYLTKAYKSTGADYAEYFEWFDGNPNHEDRVGHFVTLDGNKIRIAEPGDYILGIVSGQPCVIGNADEDWLGRWEHDDFNRFVKEYLIHNEVEIAPPEGLDEFGIIDWITENDLKEHDGKYYKTETEIVDYETPSWRHKANPNYDSSQPYIERQDRQEWDAVGMMGVLSVIDDGSCEVNGYAKVSSNGIATKADVLEYAKSWRVISRVSDRVIKIVFSL